MRYRRTGRLAAGLRKSIALIMLIVIPLFVELSDKPLCEGAAAMVLQPDPVVNLRSAWIASP
jgi:hypothetical protein